MGWLFPYHTQERSTLIQDRIKGWEHNGIKAEVIKHCTRGNNLWKLIEITHPDGKVERIVALDMMQKSDGVWGYKDLDETCGPYYVNCPLSYVESSTQDTEHANRWKDGVREYWAKKRNK